eukprot:TRINITY_DN4508_c0_g1_i15.p1 TRINITY_DN4508_c0_g1~~TRINITY_DN4508_c0_g1_i15.p1  ORF type:complete len:423 (-),score=133.80 TRINITY_DN4508_c0_g1_i15:446-1714(-)
MRCLLNIFGVIMFLRLGWVVGNAGILLSSLIIIGSCIVTLITTLSLSAICTNGEVKGGGAYYLISRALGPEFGGAIGILFAMANAIAVALYLVGFAEALVDAVGSGSATGTLRWDMTLYAMCSLVFLFVVAIVGVGWVVKFDYVQIVLLCLAILLVFLGSFFNSTDPTVGFVGSGSEAFSANLGSEFRDGETFWSCLAVFFPAVTGIMAGANISGDLKDAQVAIPKGTIWAVGVSSIVYLALTWAVGASYLRGPPDVDWGLYMDKLMMTNMSLWAPIVYVGVICATLSSALASLVGAPRVLQAVARDNLFPVLRVFGNGHGVNNEPYEAYLLTVAVATVCIFAGDLNSIAALITNFFLISYTLINYSCFAASFSESPGWRPRFKFFNHYVALLGTLICIAFMFLISWITSLATFFIGGLIYK